MVFLTSPLASNCAPLFSLLDDYDIPRSSRSNKAVATPPFIPTFDVYETNDTYHLHGELPGVSQEDIAIEFTDPQTMSIKGHMERRDHLKTNSTRRINQKSSSPPPKYHQPTVEEDSGEDDGMSTASSSSSFSQVTPSEETESPTYKYLISERSTGDFYRVFSFATRVDQDSVRARLQDGILSISVPKERAPQLKKIRVE
ncbi:HSP20-like chaperone [Aspergillus campestris IBT 28561]|uniref:HSP20-like chaperone n=1 Tax=Aspergillus campestris (strain IBT 28561) TaxID=1392248 RepID=A0A2I1D2B7_ASPC2|nr:HSP20-like chaperone [Aspergillus campestris IBT 28561]PKY04009.1 HSP20-like chaperone [Aspergillus campestris IBT 28561]